MGSLTFRARFPENVTFEQAPAAFRAQKFEETIAITTVRLTAVIDGNVAATKDFPAAERQGELVNLAEGLYEIRVEGLVGSQVVLRAVKTGVRIETAKVRDAGEFFLAPVAPKAPVLSAAPPAVTSVATLSLAGAKEMFTGIRVNGVDAVAANDSGAFSLTHPLTEGANAVKVVAFTEEGNESNPLTLSVTLDRTPPKPVSFAIAGSPAAVSNPTVTLLIAADEAVEMNIAADSNFSGGGWLPYETSVTLTLADLDGAQTLYVKFRDRAGNESAALSTSVVLDRQAPASASVQVAQGAVVGAVAVTLNLSAAGAAQMQISADPDFAAAAWVAFATTSPFTLTGGDGVKTVYARFRDAVGNVGAATSTTVVLDTAAPAAPSIAIVGAPVAVSAATVSLALSATGTPTEMQISEDPAFTAAVWVAYATTSGYTLSGGDGVKTVYARFRDGARNVSASASTSVALDTTAPAAGTVSVNGGAAYTNAQLVSLSIVATGAAEMQLDTSPSFGGAAWQAYAPTAPFTLPATQAPYTVYARFRDAAGLVSSVIGSNVVTLDQSLPAITVFEVAGSPAYASSQFTSVTLVASDTSALEMRFATDPAFASATSWAAYNAAPVVDLGLAEGGVDLYVEVRDGAGNVNQAGPVSLILDLTAPSEPTLLAASPNPSAGSFALSWLPGADATSGILHYEVEESPDTFSWSPVGVTADSSFALVRATGSYYFRVRSIDKAGLSSIFTGPVGVTIDTTPPTAGTVADGLSVDVQYQNDAFTVSANWTGFFDDTGITNYDVAAGTTPGGTDVIAFVPAGLTSSQSLAAGLTEGVTIYVTVRAYDNAGNFVDATSDGVTLDATPPTVAAAPGITPNPNGGNYTVTWGLVSDAISGVDYYELWKNGVPVTTVAAPPFVVSGAPQGTYTYEVRAYDLAGNASGMSAVSPTVIVDLTPPTAPWSMSVAPNPATGPVTATWFAGSDGETGVAGYIVETSPDSFTWTPYTTTTSTSASLSLGEGTHYVRAIAYDGVNLQSAPSDVYMVTIDQTPPTAGVVFDGPDFDLDYGNDAFAVSANWFAFSDNVTIATYHMAVGTVLFGNDLVDFTNVGYTSFATLSTSLSDGMTVYATVRAIDPAGNMAYATSNGFVVDTTPPPPPGAPAVAPNPTTGPVTVSWAPVTDATSGVAYYEVWANGAPVTSTVATAVALNMPLETMYVFSIAAYDAAGNPSFGTSSPSVIVDQTGPTAPTNLAVSPNPSTGPVTVSWDAAFDAGSGVAGYTVETSADGFTWSPVATTQTTTFELGLSDGTHYVRVIAFDSVGLQGPDSGGAMVTVDTLAPTPVSLAPSFGALLNAPSVTLDISAIDADEMQLSEDPAFTAASWIPYAIGTDFSLTPVDGAKTVYIRFRDLAGNLSSALSVGVTLDTTLPPDPAAPTVFPSPTTMGYTVSWAAVSDATGIAHYEVWENGGWVTNAVGTNFVIPNPPEGSYFYQVRAVDGAGNASNPSASSLTAVVDRSAPNAPAAPTFSGNPVSGPVTVSWSAVSDVGAAGVQDYALERSSDGGTTWSLAAVTASTSYFFNLSGGNYLFRVAAQDLAGNKSLFSPVSANLAVNVSGPTSPLVAIEGSPAWVTTANVKLLLSAVGATTYEVDEEPGFGTPQSGPMTSSTNYTLSPGDGFKIVFARYSDGVLYSAVVSTAVSLDTAPPALTDVTLAGGAAAVSTATAALSVAATGAFEMSVTGDAVAPRGWVPYTASSSVTLATRSGRYVATLGSASFARGVTVQSDGKIIVAGYATNAADDWTLARYNPDGTPDNSFGTNGVVTVDFNALADFAYDVAVRADGKIFAAGTFNNGSKGVAAVMAFNADGTPFVAYGPNSNGKTFLNIGGSTNDGFTRIKFDGANRLYAVGWTFNGITAYDAVIARFDTSGSLDTTFNGQGYATRDIASGNQQAAALAFDATGRIVVGGYNANDFLVMRYATSGAADSVFNGTGYVTTSISANADTVGAVIVQADDKILAVGQGNNGQNRIAMARYAPNGALDTTFGAGAGTVLTGFAANDAAIGGAQLGDGKILVGGRAGNDFMIARFNADGSVDNAFAQGGWRAIDLLGSTDTPAGFLMLGDKTAMVVGQAFNGAQNHWAVVRVDGLTGKPFGGFGPFVEGLKTLFVSTRDQAGNLSSQLMRSVTFDKTPPTALAFSVQGAPAEVTSTNITLATLMSESGLMQISESPGFGGAPWIGYSTTTPFALSPSDGTKTIYIRFRDPAGNVSGVLSTSVNYRSFGLDSLSVGTGFDGDVVTLDGFGFGAVQGGSFVRFGPSSASVQSWSDTQITVWVPTAAGPGNQPVTIDKGGQISNGLPFLVRPRITTVAPGSGSGGTGISLSGYNFGASTATLKLGGMPVTTSGWSMMNVNFTIPNDVTAGSQPIEIFAAGVSSDTQWVSIYPNMVTLTPTTARQGDLITITGTNFGGAQGPSTLDINAQPVTAATWNANTITFTVPPSVPAGAANVSVTVGGYPSNMLALTVKPFIASVTPVTATSGNLVTIAGSAFGASKGGSQFLIGGAPTGEDSWSDTSLTWTVPAGLPAGSYPIQVQVNGELSDPAPFFVNPNVASLSAVTAPVGVVISLFGTNFGATQTSSTVAIGGQGAAVQSWSSSTIDVWVPANLAPGTHPVIVTVGGRPSAPRPLNVTKADRLAYMTAPQGPVAAGTCSAAESLELRDSFGIPAPATSTVTVTMSAPNVRFYTDSGCLSETSTLVISPSFSDVTFWYKGVVAGAESMNASAPGLLSADQTATIEAGAAANLAFAGPVNIGAGQCAGYTVRSVDAYGNLSNVGSSEPVTLGGQGAGSFYTDPGCGAFGNVVTIATGTSTVGFWFQDASPESLNFTATGAVLTGANYGVNVTGGASGPVITSLSVGQGRPGSSLTIYGSGFGAVQGKGHVAIGGAPISALGLWSDTQISVTTWYGPAGTVPVVVWADGKPSNGYPFENQQMFVVSRTPRAAAINEPVTITGGYFGAISGPVSFSGMPATVLSWSDTALQVRVPPTGGQAITINDSAVSHSTGTYVHASDAGNFVPLDDIPEARANHTAVWTGTEMLVWGGESSTSAAPSRGGRYNPAFDTWLPMNPAGTNHRRAAAVWTGGSLIVFGGTDGVTEVDTLQRYSPFLDTWDTLPADTGFARQGATAVWTGHEVIVWGGEAGGSKMSAGRRFDPLGNTWSSLATGNEPSARSNHTVVWTGGEMIVWGGVDQGGNALGDGARYSNAADLWMALPATGAPDARQYHTAVWTGNDMLVWGGYADLPPYERQDGARYNRQTDSWSSLPVNGSTPAGRDSHTAVWTGEEMIVFGGTDGGAPLNTGGAYRVTDATWTALTLAGAPLGRIGHSAVFTGQDMIVWGGDCGPGCQTNTGGRFNVVSKTWAPTALPLGMPSPRTQHQAVWTGAEMIVWGGYNGTYLNTGGRYNPATDTWMATSTTGGAPAGRVEFTMLWNGSRVDIQSGQGDTLLGDGYLYDPATDSWTLKSATNSLGARSRHTAVWTGTEAVFYGGWDGFSHFGDGKRYDPALDTWATVAVLNGPGNRSQHTAVWSGAGMIVWGGYDGSFLNTGAIYYPAGNTWATMTTLSAPAVRSGHTAVWNGLEMVVYGGTNGTVLGDGGKYSPSLDQWLAFTPAVARQKHTAVWNGANMLVFGGSNVSGSLADLESYDSGLDAWTPIGAGETPVARFDHTAVWTGTELLIWGGDDGRFLSSGGRYK